MPRRQGALDAKHLIRTYLLLPKVPNGTPEHDAIFWAFECMDAIATEAPSTALWIITAALKLAQDDQDIDFLAAGPLEDLLDVNGPEIIEEIEKVAAENERFRYLLSGVWGENSIDPAVWRRLQIILEQGPWLSDDPRTPQGSNKANERE